MITSVLILCGTVLIVLVLVLWAISIIGKSAVIQTCDEGKDNHTDVAGELTTLANAANTLANAELLGGEGNTEVITACRAAIIHRTNFLMTSRIHPHES